MLSNILRDKSSGRFVGADTIERFWSFVKKGNGPNDCWLWTGFKNSGYGKFRLGSKKISAHVFSYMLCHGQLPEAPMLRHKCPGGGNRSCVNPAHLIPGTHKDNMDDRDLDGRTPRGSKQGRAKLSESIVAEARNLYASGSYTGYELADRFGVSGCVMYLALKRRTWRHVP